MALKLKLSDRFVLKVGPVEMTRGANLLSGREWGIQGPMAGWNKGEIYAVPKDPDKTVSLVVSIDEGRIDACIDGNVLFEDMWFKMPSAGNEISIYTWGGNSVTFAVDEVSSHSRNLLKTEQVHPVLESRTGWAEQDE